MADNLVKALSEQNIRQIIGLLRGTAKQDESAGIKIYSNGETYKVGEVVTYKTEDMEDYSLLICIGEHTASTDIPDMTYFCFVDSTIIENFTDEEIAELFDLSEEEVIELTKLIDDAHIAANKLYSSQRVEDRLVEILTQANEYSTELLGKANFLTIEIVASESEVVNSNVLYLIDDGTSTNTYNQFVLVNGTVTSLGNTTIDLSDYYTKGEITTLLDDYAKKNECLTTNDVVTELNDTVTNSQIPSALSIYEKTKDTNMKTYTKIEQLGLTAPVTTFEIFSAMPFKSFANIPVRASGVQLVSDLPETTCNGILIIDKYDSNCFSVMFKRSNAATFENYLSIAHFNGADGSNLRWDKVYTTNNLTTTIDSTSTNEQVPSAKAVYDQLQALKIYDNTKTLKECLDVILTDSNFEILIARDIHVYCLGGTYYCRAMRINNYSIMGCAYADSDNTDTKSYSFNRRYYNSSETILIALN